MGVPLVLFLAMFIWSTFAFYANASVPPNALPVYVVGKQWMWHLEHPGGQREINELHVPLGRPVELVLASQDVIHSFSIPGFRVKQDVVPGRYTHLWFEATKTGDFRWFCTQFCGTSHSHMVGRVVVMTPPEYEAWLARTPAAGTMQAQGAARFHELACDGCHESRDAAPGIHAPVLEGLYGHAVALRDGRTVVADERFLHDAILAPNLQVPAGYESTMPSYRGQVDEEQILEIVAYLKSLRERPAGDTP
jgi:cytochrome c oxidase subunit 2